MISALNILVAITCFAIAGMECHHGHFPPAFAYAGFALGYVGLAWSYGAMI